MKLLVSACLMGVSCRYNTLPATAPGVPALAGRHALISVCPEQLGDLPTPREPAEIRYGRIYGGCFSGTLTDGNGIAALLAENGVRVLGQSQIDKIP